MKTWQLPPERQVRNGRTFSSPWCPATYGAALERPAPKVPRRIGDLAFGFALACVVAAFAYLAFAKMLPGAGS